AWRTGMALMRGGRVALGMMRAEGWPNVHARHDRLARATRAAALALGLRLLAPESPSPAATAGMLPQHVDGSALFRYLRDRLGVPFAGRPDRLKGRILPLPHLRSPAAFPLLALLP